MEWLGTFCSGDARNLSFYSVAPYSKVYFDYTLRDAEEVKISASKPLNVNRGLPCLAIQPYM